MKKLLPFVVMLSASSLSGANQVNVNHSIVFSDTGRKIHMYLVSADDVVDAPLEMLNMN